MKKRLGEILMERQLLSADQLNVALAHQRQWNMRLGAALVAKGFITERDLTHVLAESLGIPLVDLSKIVVDAKAMTAVPVEICEQHDLFPIALKQQKGRPFLILAMADPLNFSAIDEISFRTGCKVQPAIALLSSVGQAIRKFYYEQRAVVITPLEGETPLNRSGRPVNSAVPLDLPASSLSAAAFMAEVERPELGGPGQARLSATPVPTPVTTGSSMPAAPRSGAYSAAIPGVSMPATPSIPSMPAVGPMSGGFSVAGIPGVTNPSLPAAPRTAPGVAAVAAATPFSQPVTQPTPRVPAPVFSAPEPAEESDPLPGVVVSDATDDLPLIELTAEAETGTFQIANPTLEVAHAGPVSLLEAPADPPPQTLKALAASETESLEEKFWALMQVLNARGVVTKEEFLAQLRSRR